MMSARLFVAVPLAALLLAMGAGSAFAKTKATPTSTPTPTPPGPTVRGNAYNVQGKLAKNAPVTLIDSSSEPVQVTVSTNKNGVFVISVVGLTPPFLIAGPPGLGPPLFSMAFRHGEVNINPYTSLVLTLIYLAQGSTAGNLNDMASNFSSGPPTPEEIFVVTQLLKGLIHNWLVAERIPPGFNFFQSSFPANGTGFDKLLSQTSMTVLPTRINFGVVDRKNRKLAENTVFTFDTSSSAIIATDSLVVTSVFFQPPSSQRILSTLLPVDTDVAAAIDGVKLLLRRFAGVVNGQGGSLSASAFTAGRHPLLDPGYLNEGEFVKVGAADLATQFRGASVSTPQLFLINPDSSGSTLDATITMTRNGATTLDSQMFNCGPDTLKNGTPICDFFGNQRIARSQNAVRVEKLVDSKNSQGPTSRQNVEVEASAPEGSNALPTVSQMFISDSSLFINGTELQMDQGAKTVVYKPVPSGKPLKIDQDVFTAKNSSFRVAAITDVFTLDVLPGPGLVVPDASFIDATSDQTYTNAQMATTSEAINLTAPSLTGDHTIQDAHPGKSLRIKWAPIQTFQVVAAQLSGFASDCSRVVNLPTRSLSPHATTASIRYPAKINGGGPTGFAEFKLSFDGLYGEHSALTYEFGTCS
jgi:hypothetical protein